MVLVVVDAAAPFRLEHWRSTHYGMEQGWAEEQGGTTYVGGRKQMKGQIQNEFQPWPREASDFERTCVDSDSGLMSMIMKPPPLLDIFGAVYSTICYN